MKFSPEQKQRLDALIQERLARQRAFLERTHRAELAALEQRRIDDVSALRLQIVQLEVQLGRSVSLGQRMKSFAQGFSRGNIHASKTTDTDRS